MIAHASKFGSRTSSQIGLGWSKSVRHGSGHIQGG